MTYNPQEIEILTRTVDATRAGQSAYANVALAAGMVAGGLLVAHGHLVNPANLAEAAHTSTDLGNSYVDQLRGAEPVAAPAFVAPAEAETPKAAPLRGKANLEKVTGFVPPAKITRRANPNATRSYDFAGLELGQAIFVPATEKRPNPKKSLGSTISAANKRFATFDPPRFFKAYGASQGQVFGTVIAPMDGAYITRIEPPAPGTDAPAE